MRTTMRRDLTAALKARDRVAVSALRSALAAIDNAEAVPVPDPRTSDGERVPEPASGGEPRAGSAAAGEPRAGSAVGGEHVAGAAVGVGAGEAARRELTPDDLHAIVAAEVAERVDAATGYARSGREDAADRLRAEADVLRRYLRPE
jgi:uncharacterized protein YqeY